MIITKCTRRAIVGTEAVVLLSLNKGSVIYILIQLNGWMISNLWMNVENIIHSITHNKTKYIDNTCSNAVSSQRLIFMF